MSDLIPRGRVDAATRSEALAVLHAYADGDLLSRVEAANDPEVRKAVLSTADLDAAAEVMTQLTAEDLPAVTWHRAASRAVLRAALEVTDDE